MTSTQIENLIQGSGLQQPCSQPQLLETHISWVILCDDFVYKIKKPVKFDFLDFSTLEQRKFYCEKELELNRRLTSGMYLDVLPVREDEGSVSVGAGNGKIADHAVKMTRIDPGRRMDLLLARQEVTVEQVQAIAGQLAAFHQRTLVCHYGVRLQLQHDFNDLLQYAMAMEADIGKDQMDQIQRATDTAAKFLKANTGLLNERSAKGFIRDCHGDLHSGNIFLLNEPVIFDCIEFNDSLRQIDILNELAFLCMDLEFYHLPGLAQAFFDYYNHIFPVCGSKEEEELFVFYKAYKANVRAKIHLMDAEGATDDEKRNTALHTGADYLLLMDGYLGRLR